MTKTTFYVDKALLARLKTAAAQHDSTIRELLTEGAGLILDHYEGRAARRKRAARQRSARLNHAGASRGKSRAK